MLDACFTPGGVGVEHQFSAAGILEVPVDNGQLCDQGVASVDSNIAADPRAAIQTEYLRATVCFCGSAEKCVAEPGIAGNFYLRTIRPAKGQKAHHSLKPGYFY